MSTALFEAHVTQLDAEAENIAAAFGGVPVSQQIPNRESAEWKARLLRTEQFLEEIRIGKRPVHHFFEAMSKTDFPHLFADSLDRQLYGAYEATPTTWQNYARASTVNDFRPVKRFATTGVRGILQRVGELAEHPRRTTQEISYEYRVNKYEAGFELSFEQLINDDLGAFLRLPQDLAQSVRDSEEHFVTTLYCDENGPKATVYNAANDNLLDGNPPLTREALQAAITKLMKRKDERGNPIRVQAVELVVGAGLSLAAQEIINATEYRAVDANGNVTIIRGNGVSANLRVNTNYFIDSIAETNADTSWWLFASPSSVRPALEFGRLRGYTAPMLFMKKPDMQRVGGGDVQWSFNYGAVEYKVQHIFGGAFIDPRMTVASNGSGA